MSTPYQVDGIKRFNSLIIWKQLGSHEEKAIPNGVAKAAKKEEHPIVRTYKKSLQAITQPSKASEKSQWRREYMLDYNRKKREEQKAKRNSKKSD